MPMFHRQQKNAKAEWTLASASFHPVGCKHKSHATADKLQKEAFYSPGLRLFVNRVCIL